MIKSPDYIYATYAAHEILARLDITSLPIDIKSIVRSHGNIRLFTYDDFAVLNGMTRLEVSSCFNEEAGACIKERDKEKYIIVYDNCLDEGIQRFTIGHEYGHIMLNHFNKLNVDALSNSSDMHNISDQKEIAEKEANCFARNILSPIHFRKLYKTATDIANLADITIIAAKIRLERLQTDIYNFGQADA